MTTIPAVKAVQLSLYTSLDTMETTCDIQKIVEPRPKWLQLLLYSPLIALDLQRLPSSAFVMHNSSTWRCRNDACLPLGGHLYLSYNTSPSAMMTMSSLCLQLHNRKKMSNSFFLQQQQKSLQHLEPIGHSNDEEDDPAQHKANLDILADLSTTDMEDVPIPRYTHSHTARPMEATIAAPKHIHHIVDEDGVNNVGDIHQHDTEDVNVQQDAPLVQNPERETTTTTACDDHAMMQCSLG